MKQLVYLIVIGYSISSAQTFDEFFTDTTTMRVDYFRIGTKGQERIILDKIYEERNWSGSKVNLIDTLNLGDCFVSVYDQLTSTLIYSRGYSTIFREWQTTQEALDGTWKTFHETVRFPYPKQTVIIRFYIRDKFVAAGEMMEFRELFFTVVDPKSPTAVIREKRKNPYTIHDVMINGHNNTKVDILILGDGYTKSDIGKFREDTKHFTETLFSYQPFKKRKNDFNVRALEVISEDSGIDKPDRNIWKKTALGTMYNTFESPRYVLTEENKELRNIAGTVPYDFITILVNDNRYGGGGIYNLYTTSFTQTAKEGYEWEMDYVYVHEFGHCFGGLGDEYYSSQISYIDFYPEGVEPWEPNVTRTHTKETLKWRKYVSPDTPIPTPWRKAEYDSIETLRRKLDRLASDYYEKRENLLKSSSEIIRDSVWNGIVGAFEGSGYTSKGMYRPAIDCKMFALNPVDFDPVCAAAIEIMIEWYTK